MAMEWPGVVALAVLLVSVRAFIVGRWRTYQLSHRQAAALYASVVPLMLFAGFVAIGIDSLERLLIGVGFLLFVFVGTLFIVEFFLRALGGEMDPPASRGYRRRP